MSDRWYGIINPDGEIWWVSKEKHSSWMKFFDNNPHRLPLSEAIKAYEAVGYECVELIVKRKEAKPK